MWLVPGACLRVTWPHMSRLVTASHTSRLPKSPWVVSCLGFREPPYELRKPSYRHSAVWKVAEVDSQPLPRH